MNKIFISLILILLGAQAFAFDVVYPKKNDVTINAKSTFFIGSSDKPLKINGEDIKLHESGAFAHVVELKDGQNVFTIQSDDERKIFVITKPVVKSSGQTSPLAFIGYDEKKSFYVVTEGAPLRSTPIDAGINRTAHLQRNVNVIVDGEKNGFYRVVLAEGRYGWIAKSNVKLFDNFDSTEATVSGYDYIDSPEYFTFVFHLDKRVPFEITEDEPMLLKFFNTKGDGTYVFEFPFKMATMNKNLQGYSGEYFENDFVWKIRKPVTVSVKKPLKNVVIAIDAGHGGSEVGAIGCLGNKEKDTNLSIAKYLQAELEKRGAKVLMTRDDDIYVGLKDRVDKANAKNAVVLLSIHGNALPDGADPNKINGTSVYYYYNQAKPLADTVLEEMTSQLGTNNDKVHQASLALVRNTNALSILIETAYLINPDDDAKLVTPEFQMGCAKAIADALEKYFTQGL